MYISVQFTCFKEVANSNEDFKSSQLAVFSSYIYVKNLLTNRKLFYPNHLDLFFVLHAHLGLMTRIHVNTLLLPK